MTRQGDCRWKKKPLGEKPSRSGSAEKLLAEALVIEAEDARKAGALGYMANSLVQATIPHSRREGVTFKRSNGLFSLAITAHPRVGLPYGTIPRLLLSWLTTEAVRTKDPILLLGPTLSGFMADLDLIPTGGRWGSITRLRHQMKRLFSSSISCLYENDELDREIGFSAELELYQGQHQANLNRLEAALNRHSPLAGGGSDTGLERGELAYPDRTVR